MITPNQIKDILHYDPETGVLTWKIHAARRRKPGEIAGCKCADGRISVGINGKTYKAHRLAWAIVTGQWPKNMIDHVNGNPSDNRWSNLRIATKSQNMMNINIIKSNTSGVRGVSWSKACQKWRASIKANKHQYHLGVFETIEQAKAAYQKAAQELHGEFAHHQNLPSL